MTWVNSFDGNVVRVNRKLFTHFSVWNRQKIPGEQGEQYNRKKKDAGIFGFTGESIGILTIGMAKAITNENDAYRRRVHKIIADYRNVWHGESRLRSILANGMANRHS